MANTTNFSIEKPTVGGYRNTWGGTLNTGLDKLDELIALAMPVGSVTMYTKSTAPTATASGGTWLVCDGSAISRTTYSSLFTVIGTSFGSGDNNTTFNIPDLRARIPVGYNAGTIGSGATARTSKAVAASSGEEAHALTEGELAAHSHAIPATAHKHDITDKSHVHTGNASGNTGDASLTINDPEHDHQFNIHADWNSGNRLWHIDTICTKNLMKVHRWTKEYFTKLLGQNKFINWLRVKPDGKIYRKTKVRTKESWDQ